MIHARPFSGLLPVVVATLLLVIIPAGVSHAQAADSLRVGVRVRVRETPTGVWRVGTLAAPVGDSIHYRRCRHCYTYAVPVTDSTRMEVSVGRHSSGERVLRGALTGAITGVALGAVAGFLMERGKCEEYCGIAPAVLGTLGFSVGLPLGFIIGIAPVDRWVPAPLRVE